MRLKDFISALPAAILFVAIMWIFVFAASVTCVALGDSQTVCGM